MKGRQSLPGIAFATNARTGATIAIRHGEPRYYRVETSLSADELNRLYGVSAQQARAMMVSLLRAVCHDGLRF